MITDKSKDLIEKPKKDDNILREVVGDYTNDTKRKQELSESDIDKLCLLYTSPSPRDATLSRMPSSA